MANTSLKPLPPLEPIDREFDGIVLKQVHAKAIVSVAIPLGGLQKLNSAFTKSYGLSLPNVGSSAIGKTQDIVVFGMQIDQVFMMFDEAAGSCNVDLVRKKLGTAGYYTDQSDSWVILRISGPKVRTALERICMLDLAPDKFVEGAVSRTQMEHLGVIIFRSGEDEFTLFSARSSADSFHHAVETSILNVTQ